MPPNPFVDIDAPVIQPEFPPLMEQAESLVEPPLGERKVLVILIDFPDNPWSITADQFDSLIYGENQNSMRDYYTEVSHGKFTISQASVITQWVRAPRDYSYYIGDSFGIYPGTYPNNVQGIVVAACSLADPLVDFSGFDEDGDNMVDALFVVHAGHGAEETGNPNLVWSHKWQLSNTGSGCPGPYQGDGVEIDVYSMEPELIDLTDSRITVGVFAHEFGHVLGLPDLYDRDGSTVGIGLFGIMAAGSWGDANGTGLLGEYPTHFCAWAKYQFGWLDNLVEVARYGVPQREDLQVAAAASNPIAVRMLEDPNGADWEQYEGGTGEYFLIENRFQTGFDRSLPGNGLLILHVDDSRQHNDTESHPLVGIMQADGDEDFLLSNLGEDADLWKNSTYGFGDTSKPNSFDYDGNPTGVWVYDIGSAGSVITASFWVTPVFLGRVYSYPNPFIARQEPSWGSKVIITYVPSDTMELGQQFPSFKVSLFNIAGELVRVLDSEPTEVDPFARRAYWDLMNERGQNAVSGMYVYIIEVEKTDGNLERQKGRLTIIR